MEARVFQEVPEVVAKIILELEKRLEGIPLGADKQSQSSQKLLEYSCELIQGGFTRQSYDVLRDNMEKHYASKGYGELNNVDVMRLGALEGILYVELNSTN